MCIRDRLKTHPLANASSTDQEILTFPYVNLSVAVATDYGLTSPVVRDADQMSLVELSRALREIVVKAREKRLTADDQRDGTFTLTNMGVFPVDNFNPILPAPQSCIMGFGRAVEKPVVYQGQICVRTMMCQMCIRDRFTSCFTTPSFRRITAGKSTPVSAEPMPYRADSRTVLATSAL